MPAYSFEYKLFKGRNDRAQSNEKITKKQFYETLELSENDRR